MGKVDLLARKGTIHASSLVASGSAWPSRAFVTRPAVLFADEPAGDLDTATGERVMDLLFDELGRSHDTGPGDARQKSWRRAAVASFISMLVGWCEACARCDSLCCAGSRLEVR
jgi:hypothetical protein